MKEQTHFRNHERGKTAKTILNANKMAKSHRHESQYQFGKSSTLSTESG
jgi:hypothetical protein